MTLPRDRFKFPSQEDTLRPTSLVLWRGSAYRMVSVASLAVIMHLPVLAQSDLHEAISECRRLENASARLACYDAMSVASRPGTRPAGAPVAVGADQARFGLESREATSRPEALESTIRGAFEGWGPGDRLRLANGQVWQIADDSSGVVYATDPKVRIRRGALGAFYLEVAGTNRSPRVRRLE